MPQYLPSTSDDVADLRRQVRELHTLAASIPSDATDAPWLSAAALGSGWADLNATDSGFDTIGFQVRPGGRVACRGGVMRSGSAWPGAGFTLLTLPAGVYPVKKQVLCTGSPYGNGFVSVEFDTAGAVKVTGWGGNTTGQAGTAVGLDQIVYRIA